jgi:hypothetical protein
MTNPAWSETERRDGIKECTTSFTQKYRFGFNNQEQETELGEFYSFEYADDCRVLKKPLQCRASTTFYPIVNWVNRRDRVHDARLGRFLSVDPLAPEYPWNSTYAFAEDQVIWAKDLEGKERLIATIAQDPNNADCTVSTVGEIVTTSSTIITKPMDDATVVGPTEWRRK